MLPQSNMPTDLTLHVVVPRIVLRCIGVTEQLTDQQQLCVTRLKLQPETVLAIAATVDPRSRTPTLDLYNRCVREKLRQMAMDPTSKRIL